MLGIVRYYRQPMLDGGCCDEEVGVFELASPAKQVRPDLRELMHDGPRERQIGNTRQKLLDLQEVRFTVSGPVRAKKHLAHSYDADEC